MELSKEQALQSEWRVLHVEIEHYERNALYIKLVAIVCILGCLIYGLPMVAFITSLIFWLQESIWKTFQGRIEDRVLKIEAALKDNDRKYNAYSLYSEWQDIRPPVVVLCIGYLKNMLRPTIAFPHVALAAISLVAIIGVI